jgi:hypothetical protein
MYQAGPFHPPSPYPTSAGSPLPPEVIATSAPSHDAILAAIRKDKDLQTRVRESSGAAVLTPLPSRIRLPSHTDMVGDRRGDDTAQHTDMVIVEDTQGSPNDAACIACMDVESPMHGQHPSARMEHVRMETLDLGGDDDEADLIQHTQVSHAGHATEAMEVEAVAPMEVMNAHLLIEEEGTARSSTATPPPNDEVALL